MKIKKQVTATIELEDEDVQMLKAIAEAARVNLVETKNAYNLDYNGKLLLFLDKIFDI